MNPECYQKPGQTVTRQMKQEVPKYVHVGEFCWHNQLKNVLNF